MPKLDDIELGKFIVSFAVFLPKFSGDQGNLGGSVGFVMVPHDRELLVVKLPPQIAQSLSLEIGKYIQSIPKEILNNSDQYKFMQYFDAYAPTPNDFPESTAVMSKNQYVKFAHINRYIDGLIIDVSFFDNSATRLSFAPIVALTFKDSIDAALSNAS
mgnify:CR=1 FL=1